jgi:acetylglutamate kinase
MSRLRRLSTSIGVLLLAAPLLSALAAQTVARDTAGSTVAAIANSVPVVSPISGDADGQSYNVNADSAAAALAAAAGCTDLVFVTDVPGVMVAGEIQPRMSVDRARALIADGTITGGMVAKMESVFEALDGRVPRVHVIQWQGPGTLQRIVTGEKIPGTSIHA